MATYFFGLWWYRLSDYIFMTYVLPDEPEERYWVVKFKLRHPKDYKGDDELMSISDRLILCMYYMLTTLSTVGYGDFYPFSIAEKIVGSLIQIIGVTIFSIVMNAFIGVVVSGRQNTFKDNETNLQRWFNLIKKIRSSPMGEGKDIDIGLRTEIEGHFTHFWEHDRVAVLLEKKDYFDSIPFKI